MNTQEIGDDMREHFERIITRFVDLSAQSRELEHLKHQIAEVQNRLQELGLTNSSLRSEIGQAWDAVRQVEADRDTYRRQVEERDGQIATMVSDHQATVQRYDNSVADFQNAVAARDGTIGELADRLNLAISDAEEQRARANNLENGLRHWSTEHDARLAERDSTRQANAELVSTVNDLTAQLRSAEAQLARVRSVFETVAPALSVVG